MRLLHNSLNKLIFLIDTIPIDGETVLTKSCFFNLENVNTLIKIRDIDQTSLDLFFNVLKQHIKLLKYQFKQLNIGIMSRFEMESVKNLL